ncbi:hypothetical protein [Arcobacter sp. LA11]|uniref:hypothetical protein n=1 Tax=Arcobacter sp. LA11 TaxID=1898176 RepID=UPI000932233F|nr:hypothetical protein [Arcobacter sp. LA11]
MSKLFIYIFIIFGLVTSSIILFTPEKEKKKVLIEDKNVQQVIQKEIKTVKSNSLTEVKIREEKKKILTKKNENIKSKIEEIDKLVSKADNLIEDNKLTAKEIKEENKKKEKVDKINQKFKDIKSDLENLK